MPAKVVILKVFLASPSDVVDERTTLEEIIRQLNKMPGDRLGIRLDLLKSETDTYPGVGESPQSVINRQIGDDYNVFIGILWKRFGTPTNNQDSGTAEEFQRAYDRATQRPNELQVMLYFNESPVSLSDLDLEQYGKVDKFKKSLSQKGVYYGAYKKTEDFGALVRFHLGTVMENFGSTWGQAAEVLEHAVDVVEPESDFIDAVRQDEEADAGFLDLIISTMEDMASAGASLTRMKEMLLELNQKTEQSTEELNQLPKPINPSSAILIVNKQADAWDDFSQRFEAELPILSTRFRAGVESYAKAVQLLEDFGSKDNIDQVIGALDVIRNLKSAAASADESTGRFRAAIVTLPRLSVRVNHAKRRLREVLDKSIDEYKAEQNLAAEAEKIIAGTLAKYDQAKE